MSRSTVSVQEAVMSALPQCRRAARLSLTSCSRITLNLSKSRSPRQFRKRHEKSETHQWLPAHPLATLETYRMKTTKCTCDCAYTVVQFLVVAAVKLSSQCGSYIWCAELSGASVMNRCVSVCCKMQRDSLSGTVFHWR
mmetsp:Transcript_18356/g.44225  ORF Transcript_18356/g.44225 Transcript_18356/m.44225 type:complete len:139 (-) Transcript_18356:261-677(-)